MDLYTTVLYTLTSSFLAFMGVLIFRRDDKSWADYSLLVFIVSTILYMVVIYLGYSLIDPDEPALSTFFIRQTFFWGMLMTLALVGFGYYYPRKTNDFSRLIVSLFIIAGLLMGLFASLTDLVYEREIIINGVEIEDVHGPYHNLFLLHYWLNALIAIFISMRKYFSLKGVEKNRSLLSLIGILTVVFTIILFHTILPKFNIYLLQIEVILFSLVFVILSFYSMLKYRFLDIKFTVSSGTKLIFALGIGVLVGAGVHFGFEYFFPTLPDFVEVTLSLFSAVYVFHLLHQLFYSSWFHEIFWITDVELLNKLVDQFMSLNKRYKDIDDLEADLRDFFVEKFKVKNIDLIVKGQGKGKNCPVSIVAQRYKKIIVQKEIPFMDISNKDKQLLGALKENGYEIILPLFQNEKKLIGFCAFGAKLFDDLYSEPEITSLERLQGYLGLQLSSTIYSSELKKDVRSKTLELREKNKQLLKLDKAKDDFLAIASHELRTPMTVIKGYSDFLLSQKFGPLNGEQTLFIQKIFKNSRDLIDLVSKMLELSALETGEMEFHFADTAIEPILSAAARDFTMISASKKIAFVFENPEQCEPIIRTDEEKLKIVLNNLLGNAFKFTDEGGQINFKIESGSEKFWRISVADTGVGIPKADQGKVFQKFKQSDNVLQQKYAGSGLGLSIVKQIVETLGGEIGLKSEVGKGSEFYFTLPK